MSTLLDQRDFDTDIRYGCRPRQADCKNCDGYGFKYFGKDRTCCPDCLGLGLDLIPWTELLKVGRWER